MFFPAKIAGRAAFVRPFLRGKQGSRPGRGERCRRREGPFFRQGGACNGRGRGGRAPEQGKAAASPGCGGPKAKGEPSPCQPKDADHAGHERKSPAGRGFPVCLSRREAALPLGGISFRRLLPHRGWRRSRNRRPRVRWGLRVRRRASRPGSFRAVPCCFPWPA